MRASGGLAVLLALSLAACGQSPAAPSEPAPSKPASSAAGALASKPSSPGSPAAGASKPLERVKVSFAAKAAIYAPHFIAIEKGYYAQEGIELDVVDAGGGVATPALMSGDLPYSTSSDSALSAIIKGASLRIVYTNTGASTQQLWARADIQSAADLKGKTIGLATRGDSNEVSTRVFLQSQGVDPDSVAYTALGPGSAPLAALQGGSVPAAVISPGNAHELQKAGFKGRLLGDYSTVKVLYTGLATSAKQLDQQRDLTKRLLRATAKGREYYRAFKTETIAILGKYDGLPADTNEIDYDATLKTMTAEGWAPVDDQQRDAAVRAQLLSLPKDKVPQPDKMYDYSVIKDVYQELKASTWKPEK